MRRNLKAPLVVLTLTGLVVGSSSTISNGNPAAVGGSVIAISSDSEVAQAEPMIWHLVIRIALTKAGCENIKRLMPNSGSLKCLKVGKVWVLIPKGMGY